MTLSVCVFCSSADGLPEEYRSATRDLGAELARRGHRLVYGGGNVGLMGEVARSVHSHGGTVVGVIPQGLVDRELAYDPADELLVTQTLRDHNDTFLGKSSWSSARWPCSASGCGSGARPSPSRSPLPTTRPAPASRPRGGGVAAGHPDLGRPGSAPAEQPCDRVGAALVVEGILVLLSGPGLGRRWPDRACPPAGAVGHRWSGRAP